MLGEGLCPLLSSVRQAVSQPDPLPGQQAAGGHLVEKGGVEDVVGGLGHHQTAAQEVEVVQGHQEARVAAEGQLPGGRVGLGHVEIPVLVDAHGGSVGVPAGVGEQQVLIAGQHLRQRRGGGMCLGEIFAVIGSSRTP